MVRKGRGPIQVRDWTGKSAARAVRELRAQGLQVDTSAGEFSDSVREGRVIAQDPVGEVLHRGDTVALTVSRGPELVEIPGDRRARDLESSPELPHGLGFPLDLDHSGHSPGV